MIIINIYINKTKGSIKRKRSPQSNPNPNPKEDEKRRIQTSEL